MNDNIPVKKDENEEQHVPIVWRDAISSIVDSIIERRFNFATETVHVDSLSNEEAASIFSNLDAYGGVLISLPEETWKTSICRWMGSFWLVLVDLFTTDERPSDLVLFVKVFEFGSSYRFKIDSLHVP